MLPQIFKRINLVWLVLIGATIFSWYVGHGIPGLTPRWTGVVVVVTACVKMRFVALDFMELRHAPRWLRSTVEGWLVVLCVTLVALLLGAG